MNCPKILEKMLWKIVIGLVAIALSHQFCYCDLHTNGTFNGLDEVIFEKELFDQVKVDGGVRPRNYTIIFKYIGADGSKNIPYAVFDVANAVSIGCYVSKFQINLKIALNYVTLSNLSEKLRKI